MEISRNHPLPGEHRKRSSPLPWRKLEVGESFFCPNPDTARVQCINMGAKLDRVFVQEPRVEEYEGRRTSGARVWRKA